MKRKKRSFFVGMGLVFISSIICAGTALANQKTMEVSSLEQKIDYENQIFVYRGEVRAIWGDIVMEADEMEVYLTEKNTLKEIIARGNVKVLRKEKNRQVTGTSAIYTPEDDKLIVEGQAHYQDELGNELKADKITLWITTERIEAQGTPVIAIYVLEELGEE